MISLQSTVKNILLGTGEKVYYHYPASWISLPLITWRETGNRVLYRADGREYLTELTYSVDVWAKTPEETARISEKIDDGMAELKMRRDYSADLYETSTRYHHRAMRYRVAVDAQGNTYQ